MNSGVEFSSLKLKINFKSVCL